jgi:hypothetical protein
VSKFKVLSQHLSGGIEENYNKTEDSLHPGPDLNHRPPEYEVGVLTTRRRSLVREPVEFNPHPHRDFCKIHFSIIILTSTPKSVM